MNEPRAVREIHEIRAQIYEETKHMTPDERAAHASREAQDFLDQYGLKVKRPDPPLQRKIV